MTTIQIAEHLTRCAPYSVDDLAAALVLVLPASDVDALIDALIDSFEIRRKPAADEPRFAGVMVAPLVHVPEDWCQQCGLPTEHCRENHEEPVAEAWETEIDG